jgi:hypothetical protein
MKCLLHSRAASKQQRGEHSCYNRPVATIPDPVSGWSRDGAVCGPAPEAGIARVYGALGELLSIHE